MHVFVLWFCSFVGLWPVAFLNVFVFRPWNCLVCSFYWFCCPFCLLPLICLFSSFLVLSNGLFVSVSTTFSPSSKSLIFYFLPSFFVSFSSPFFISFFASLFLWLLISIFIFLSIFFVFIFLSFSERSLLPFFPSVCARGTLALPRWARTRRVVCVCVCVHVIRALACYGQPKSKYSSVPYNPAFRSTQSWKFSFKSRFSVELLTVQIRSWLL